MNAFLKKKITVNNRTSQDIERLHFDALAHVKGEIWWGSTTAAGLRRLERRAKLLKQKLSRYSNPKVFELGCGTGAFSKYILKEMPYLDLTACDISSECIRIASSRYGNYKNVRFLVSNVMQDSPCPEMYDVIVGNSVLHHLSPRRSLECSLRSLKPGGSIIFFEPNMLNPQIAIEKNIHFIGKMLQNTENETAFLRWRLKRILREVGFDKVSVIPFDFLHPIIPPKLVNFFEKLGKAIEAIPLLKEFSGSLLITAIKP
jgi:SAM-dependent methyltransferase